MRKKKNLTNAIGVSLFLCRQLGAGCLAMENFLTLPIKKRKLVVEMITALLETKKAN